MKADSKKTATLVAAMLTALATFAWTGCSDDDKKTQQTTTVDAGPHTAFPECTAISSVCHEVDVGEGEIHDCHETAHGAKSASECTAVKDHCIEICKAAQADAGLTDDDAGDHEDAGH